MVRQSRAKGKFYLEVAGNRIGFLLYDFTVDCESCIFIHRLS